MRKPLIYILVAIVVIVGLMVAWYLASPLFINRTVDEAFPVVVPPVEDLAEMSEEELAELEADFIEALPAEEKIAEMPQEELEELEDMVMKIATVMPDKEMDEPMPTAIQEPILITQGDFYGSDDFHQGKGEAFIYQNPDGSYILRFENFEVTNGPQLHVVLGEEPNPFNHDTLGDYLDLGPLKGNIGDQNYVIPAGTDLEAYGSVVIYCVPFRVIFAIAPIM